MQSEQGVPRSWRDVVLRSRLGLAAIAVFVCVIKSGIALHPEWLRLLAASAQWPESWTAEALREGDASLLSNIATPWLIGGLGGRSETTYLALSAVLVTVAIALPILLAPTVARRRLAFVLIVGGTVPAVLLGWLGGYDALFVIAVSLAVMVPSRIAAFLGWTLMALSHSTLAFAALALWIPIALLGSRAAMRIGLAAAGAVSGWLVIRTLTDVWGGSTDRLQLLERIAPADLLRSYLHAWPVMVFSVLGVGWLVLLASNVRRHAWGRVMLGSSLVAALGLTLIAADETRIAALALLPALLAWAKDVVPDEQAASLGRRLMLPALIVPPIVIWMGTLQYAGWPTPF